MQSIHEWCRTQNLDFAAVYSEFAEDYNRDYSKWVRTGSSDPSSNTWVRGSAGTVFSLRWDCWIIR